MLGTWLLKFLMNFFAFNGGQVTPVSHSDGDVQGPLNSANRTACARRHVFVFMQSLSAGQAKWGEVEVPSVEPLPLQAAGQMDARSGWWGASGLYGGFGGRTGVGFST